MLGFPHLLIAGTLAPFFFLFSLFSLALVCFSLSCLTPHYHLPLFALGFFQFPFCFNITLLSTSAGSMACSKPEQISYTHTHTHSFSTRSNHVCPTFSPTQRPGTVQLLFHFCCNKCQKNCSHARSSGLINCSEK